MTKAENILLAVYGLTTVAVFLIMVAAGGLFDSLHSLLFREISYLISPYSLHQSSTVPLYRLYNLNLLFFSLILCIRVRNIFARVGALYLALSSLTSLLLVTIPMDALQLSHSLAGSSHIVVAMLTGLYLIAAMLLFSYSFKKNKHLAAFARYSFELCLLILVAGFLTGLFAIASMPEYVGFIQKIPVIAFLVWILLTAWWMLRADRRVSYSISFRKRSSGAGRRNR